MSVAASRRDQNIPRCRAAFERTLRILRVSRIDVLYIRERSRQISYISDTTCEPISRQTIQDLPQSHRDTEKERQRDGGTERKSVSPSLCLCGSVASTILRLRNSDRPADH